MDLVVRTPLQRVRQALHVQRFRLGLEPGEDDLALLRAAVAVVILEANEVRRGEDEEAAVGPDERGRPGEIVGEDRGLVVDAVAIGVLEHAHAAEVRRHLALLGVVAHLEHEHAAVFIEANGDRARDERLAGGQLDVKAGAHLEGRRRVFCLHGGKAWQLFRVDGEGGLRECGWRGS